MTAHYPFTPGPWKVTYIPQRGHQIEWGPNDGKERPICHMRWVDGMGPNLVVEDAHLIALAPDLATTLSALESWVRSLSEQSDENALDLLNRVRRGHVEAVNNAQSILAAIPWAPLKVPK